MFNFFRKKNEERQAAEDRGSAIKGVLAQFERGEGVPLEAVLALHLVEKSQESLSRYLMQFGGCDVWLLNKGGEGSGDPAVTQGQDDRPYVAIFSSQERAAAAAKEWQLSNHPSVISTLELVFTLDGAVGLMLNANDPHLQWIFTPEHVEKLRGLYEQSFNYEVGGIYLVRSRGMYRAAKVLRIDEGGVHIRVYANAWKKRPAAIDPGELTLQAVDEDLPRAVGHMPVSRKSFLAMGPRLVANSPVADSELDGYLLWEEAKGGYFGT